MNINEDHNFENQWQRAFADASEQPSAALWERIEQELDKDAIKIVPFWYNYAKYAAIILVMALGGYWVVWNKSKKENIATLTNKSQVAMNNKKNGSSIVFTGADGSLRSKRRLPYNKINFPYKSMKNQKNKINRATEILKEGVKIGVQSKNNTYQTRLQTTKQQAVEFIKEPFLSSTNHSAINKSENITTETEAYLPIIEKSISVEPVVADSPLQNKQSPTIEVAQLDIKDIQQLVEPIQNRLIINYETPIVVRDPVIITKKYWVSFGATVASFNPHISLPSTNSWLPYQYSNIQQKPAPTNFNDASRLSYLVQIGVGAKLRGRLGVESGIGFLMGNSVYETNTLTVDNRQFSAIADALANTAYFSNLNNKQVFASPPVSLVPAPATNGDFDIQRVENNYQFVQIPLLVSYDFIKPVHKIQIAALLGVTSSVMLQNQIQTINQQVVVYKNGASSPYQRLSVASTFGLRGSYKISQNCAMTLTANYQQTIQPIEKPTIYFTAKPQTFGLGLGLRYQFQ